MTFSDHLLMGADTSGLSTMGVVHPCKSVRRVKSIAELSDLLMSVTHPLIVGGGSNILFTRPIDRDLVVIDFSGITIVSEHVDHVVVNALAGTQWHELVMWAVDRGYGGIENLSLIPGKCGAAPMQNIGAYGVELSNVLVSVDALEMNTGQSLYYSAADCKLGYRDSIFKHALKEKVVITSITMRLTKDGYHQLNTTYGAIDQKLAENQINVPTIKDISEAVIEIRQSKLPDPQVVPNNGSFFKNPIIRKELYDELISLHPDMPSYPIDDDFVKVPAGWLIDQCGWRGKSVGQVGTYKHQALVIVNHGTTDGAEVLDFSKSIQTTVKDKFGISLTPEVNIY